MIRSSPAFSFTLVGAILLAASACHALSQDADFSADGPEIGNDSGSPPTPSSPPRDDGGGVGAFGSFGDSAPPGEGGWLDGESCATASAEAKRTPVYMLFILDGSGSMNEDGKWPAATQALDAIFADMQSKGDPGVGVGLIVFSDSYDFTFATGPYPETGIDVPVAFVDATQLDALNTRLSGQPWGETPTGTALQGGYSELETYVATAPLPAGGQKVLVLITDGVPTDRCAASSRSYSANPCVVEAGQELAKAAPAGPVLTFVIGTGVFPSDDLADFDPSFLGNLAQSGGTGPAGCSPDENATASDLCYFEVDPTLGTQTRTEQAFEAAINAIRTQVLSCTFPLSAYADAGTVDPGKVNVTLDGSTVPQGSTNGWSYDDPVDPTAITLNGSACMLLKSEPTANVQIVLGCATITAQ